MTDQLAGIEAKLKRADESIRNLDREICRHLKRSRTVFRRNKDVKRLVKAAAELVDKEVPPEFAVLAGEIVHHWRSVLDHIVWQLSGLDYRREHPEWIEFPIFREEPRDKDGLARYQRKIGGIKSAIGLQQIKELQPYQREHPVDDALAVIHDMDRFDKHRELAIIDVGMHAYAPPHLWGDVMYYCHNPDVPIPPDIAREFQEHVQFTPNIAFRQVGRGKNQPVIPTLQTLQSAIRDVVSRFEGELQRF